MVSKQAKAKKNWETLYVEVALDGTTAQYESNELKITGPNGVVSKTFKFPNVKMKVENDNIVIGTDKLSQSEKKIIFTYKAHVKNMIKGVKEGFVYTLAIVFAKFPITVELKGQEFIVKNLLGEKVPRRMRVYEGVKVELKGKEIVVSGIDKEKVGQVAANMEQLCRITNLDRRVVQDGVYITNKPHRSYA